MRLNGVAFRYARAVVLGLIMLAVPLMQGLAFHVGASALLAGVALQPLVAVPATLLGAWTSRAVISHRRSRCRLWWAARC